MLSVTENKFEIVDPIAVEVVIFNGSSNLIETEAESFNNDNINNLSSNSVDNYSIKTLNDCPKCVLGESPCWLPSQNSLLFIDISRKKVFSYNIETKTTLKMTFHQEVGMIIPKFSKDPNDKDKLVQFSSIMIIISIFF